LGEKNLAPNETLIGLFLEEEHIKRALSFFKWASLFVSGICTIAIAIVMSHGMSRFYGEWLYFALWFITCCWVAPFIFYCLVRTHNSVLYRHHKRYSYIADKLAMFKYARECLDQVYDERPETMKKYLIELAVELLFAEERLRITRTNLEKTTYELGFVLRQEEECRQRFDNTLRILHESFGLFTEFTR